MVSSGYVQALALVASALGRGAVAMEDPGLRDWLEAGRRSMA